MKYDFTAIEKKWQGYWLQNKTYEAVTGSSKPKFYALVEFPYPSGAGMHVGHIKAYSGLEVVSRPEFDVETIDENGVVLTATYFVKPEVEIADYLGIEAEKVVAEVTEEEVENEINTVRERNSREIEFTDAAAVMGDVCHINYEGFVDGVAFDGGKAENHALVLEDCDLESSVNAIINSTYGCAGMRCMALPVIVVQESIADQFVALLKKKAQAL